MPTIISKLGARLRFLRDSLTTQYSQPTWPEAQAVGKEAQILLSLKYKEFLHNKMPLPTFDDIGFRVFSQTDEDGILLYILSLIGSLNKKAVEVCAGDGIECNTANLIINHGWTALLFDGDQKKVKKGREFYSHCKDTYIFPPTFVNAWIDAENVDYLISSHGFTGEVDLLSLDMDGVDYWIWKAINCISPRIVVAEYQALWGPERAVTVPYRKDFSRFDLHPYYFGASLSAFVKLGREKGYRLVGCNRYGYNAFFIRSGTGEDIFPEVSPDTCFNHPFLEQHRREALLSNISQYDWVDV